MVPETQPAARCDYRDKLGSMLLEVTMFTCTERDRAVRMIQAGVRVADPTGVAEVSNEEDVVTSPTAAPVLSGEPVAAAPALVMVTFDRSSPFLVDGQTSFATDVDLSVGSTFATTT